MPTVHSHWKSYQCFYSKPSSQQAAQEKDPIFNHGSMQKAWNWRAYKVELLPELENCEARRIYITDYMTDKFSLKYFICTLPAKEIDSLAIF